MISYRVAIKSSVDPMPAFVFFCPDTLVRGSGLQYAYATCSHPRTSSIFPEIYLLYFLRGVASGKSSRDREEEYKIIFHLKEGKATCFRANWR